MIGLSETRSKLEAMDTIVKLSTAFEGIASMHIAQIRNQVLQAQGFFEELWHIYTQIRVDKSFHFGRSLSGIDVIDKELFVVITAAGGLSGDIDQKLISWMLSQYDPEKQDIIVIGHHGAVQLAGAGVGVKKYFELPEDDHNINVTPIVREMQSYRTSTAYYQTYVSLMIQDVKRLELHKAVAEQGKHVKENAEELISEATYIFEPSTRAVVDHLERSMLYIMLSQIILESKLAQYASRFRAMSRAHKKAGEYFVGLATSFNHMHRAQKDERLKEIVSGLRKIQS